MTTNTKKRKLNEFDVDNTDTSNRKKRKLNMFIESNESTKKQIYELEKTQKQLIKENKHLKQGVNMSKKEANKWKLQYIKLYSWLQQMANHTDLPHINDVIMNKSEGKNKIEASISHINNNTSINDINIEKNRNIKYKSKNGMKKRNRKKPIYINKSYHHNLDAIYHISVHCHVCKKHFNDYYLYETHIKQHYDNDPNKTWRTCEFICARDSKVLFNSNKDFISHISQHTNDKPFKCDFIQNGIKCDVSFGAKGSLKHHWKTHFTETQDKKPIKIVKTNENFENSYIFSTYCHICNQYFDNSSIYKQHLKKHYNDDHLRTWLTCELGCKNITSQNHEHFICHIASHTKKYPYHCNVYTNGIKCLVTAGTKGNLKKHWTRTHYISDNNISDSSSSSDESSNESLSELENDNENIYFENSYHISIHCHLCKKHFNDFYGYWLHIKKHYINDPNKQWLKCDFFACKKKSKDTAAFICHIASHTKRYPFKCNVMVNGIICTYCTSQQIDMKKHWISKHQKPMNTFQFENSYYVSIDCYICHKFFNDYRGYKWHIKQHFMNNSSRTWLECPFGCIVGNTKKILSGDEGFIYHIATHTKHYPFHCNVIVNGNKCNATAAIPGDIRKHFNTHHIHRDSIRNIIHNNESESVSESEYESSNVSELETETHTNNMDKCLDFCFENCYYISVHCHICKKHFNDLEEYKFHIKRHYNKDPNKKWRHCDFGCKNRIFKDTQSFVCHIASHTKNYPFKCDVMVNGKQCKRVSGQKSGLKTHWRKIHNVISEESDSLLESDYETESVSEIEENYNNLNSNKKQSNINFEKSYVFKMNCHICRNGFTDFNQYKQHIKKHYVNDVNKELHVCDFGCIDKRTGKAKKSANMNNFIAHIASHTKQKAYKCNVLYNGIKCTVTCATKGDYKRHWKLNHLGVGLQCFT